MARSSSSLCRWRERAPNFFPRLLGVLRFRQPVDGALLHRIAICALLAIQWFAFFTLDGAPTRHLEGPRVFSGVHNVNIFFALFALVSLGVAVASPPEQLSDFALSDQNSVFRRYSFPKQKVTAMTVADRAGSEQLEPWIGSLYERYGSRIDIDGVADVSTVPKPLHGVVHALFRKRLTHSVMLDWHGSVVKRLEYEPGAANIYVIDRRGTILKQLQVP
jgi:hypothetical protein